MNRSVKFCFLGAAIIMVMFLSGCESSGSSHHYYRSYYDPYPSWGHGHVYVDHDHYHHRPPNSRVHLKPKQRPVTIRPKQSMGRPSRARAVRRR